MAQQAGDKETRRHFLLLVAQLMQDEACDVEEEEEEESIEELVERNEIIRREMARASEEDGNSSGLGLFGTPIPMADPDEERIGRSLMNTCVREVSKLVPGPGRGRSEANYAASNRRRALVYPDGIYEAWSNLTPCPFRRNTGFERAEFDAFYEEQGGDSGHLFKVPRNHQGQYTPEQNEGRRRIKGTLRYRDRVLCWLMMLRTGCFYHELETMFGPGQSTFCRDLLWMTIQATTLPCLANEIVWTSYEERRAQASFLAGAIHPALGSVGYIADGTKAPMRNPTEPKDGRPKVRKQVHREHYSHNKGLGYSHIIYTDVETVAGRLSDRAAHTASQLFLQPGEFLAYGETGMGDGNYRGDARWDMPNLKMCVPFEASPHLSIANKNFNSMQRRARVVIENSIGQIKKWRIIGDGRFEHQRDFEPHVFELCARLTARLMRVRNAYPRSERWVLNQLESWEAKLGVFLWMDPDDAASYLVHGLANDLEYHTNPGAAAGLLQQRWEQIWASY
ncbi:unnamed protein product [Scytosiphon promiscuus]